MWLGALVGFILGAVFFQSFGMAIAIMIVGAIAGALLTREKARGSDADYFGSPPPTSTVDRPESTDLLSLQQEMRLVKVRLAEIERHLSGEPGKEEKLPAAAKSIAPVEKTVQAPAPKPVEPTKPIPAPSLVEPKKPVVAPKPPEPPKPPPPPMPPAEPSALQKFIQRWVIGGNPLVKVGVLILFLGVGFLLRYAAERVVFPVELRYISVAALGIALLLFGWRWREREDSYGLTMQGAGIGILYLTTLAAIKLHPILPVALDFTILVIVAALAAFLAVKQNAIILAIVAALFGFAAPVLASTGSGEPLPLFSYLTVLNLGIVAIAWFKSWRVLNIIGYVGSFTLGSAWATKYYQDDLFATTEPFLLLLFGMYVLVTFLFARRVLEDDSKKLNYVDGTLAFGVPFSAFWVQHILVAPYEYGASISAVGFGLFYFLLAFLLFNRAGKRYALLTETLTALGVVFGTLAIPLLETSWTAAAWGAEAAGVYWIGTRQKQTHARFFALLLLLGSAFYFLPELGWSPGGNVLDGSILSSALLTAGTGFTYWLMWRATEERLHKVEMMLRPVVAGFGAFFLATIPLLMFEREWAAPALAVLGTGLLYLSMRMSDRRLMLAGWIYQIVGGILFVSTLQTVPGAVVLAGSWAGLLGTSLVGAAMLLGFRFAAKNVLTNFSLLLGLAFLNLAPLFILPWSVAAMIWPVIGIATLIWAIRTRHLGVILFSLGLQAFAGLAHLYWRASDGGGLRVADDIDPFLHSGFIGPVIIALAAMTCARFVQRTSNENSSDNVLGWAALGWGGLWWAFAWLTEIIRVAPETSVTAYLIAVTLGTAAAWSVVARRLSWPQLGQLVLVYVPVLIILAFVDNRLGYSAHPLASWGALAWPAALLAHGLLLRRQTGDTDSNSLNFAHVLGAWLFLMQASLEAHWWFAKWGDADSAWPLLGWILVPALYVYAMTRDGVTSRWPVRDHRVFYTSVSAAPLLVYMLVYIWFTNMQSNGSASPLPYIPLLNPLEIGYLGVLFGMTAWWRSFRENAKFDGEGILVTWIFRLTAFAALTGGIIRACHHYADIPWDGSQLFESDVVQTSLSIVWGIIAISLMLLGNRRVKRSTWIIGASLVAVVVIKLFLIELSASGSLERIVSFIVVGLLLLFVGYVAPLPPQEEESG